MSARNRAAPWSPVGLGRTGLSGIGYHLPLLRLGLRLGAVSAGGTLELAAVGAAGPLLGEPVGAFAVAGDGGHPPLGGSWLWALSSTTVR
jgi:hypothetical protein